MLEQDSRSRDKFIAVASLVAASGDNPVNLGPFDAERGPFVFENTQIFPSRVLDLLREPRGLIFKVANFNITDETGRNFSFTSQEVADRTAGIVIDFGNGEKESYRVATASTFDERGITRGITMREALEIIGLSGEPGADTPLAANADLSKPEIHDTYGTVINGDGVEDLTRVRGVQHDLGQTANPETRFWVVISSVQLPVDADFSQIVLRPGENYTLAFVQDIDRDGLFAGEEFLFGSSDRNADTDGDGIGDFDEIRTGWIVATPESEFRAFSDPTRADSDNDGLSDPIERDLKSDPRKRDTDEDGLTDMQECCEGYEVTIFDGDDDPSNDPVERIIPYTDLAIIDGGNGAVNTAAASGSDDIQVLPVGAAVPAGAIVILPGPDGLLTTRPAGDDVTSVVQKLLAGRNGSVETQAVGDDIQILALGQFTEPDTIAIIGGRNGVIDTTPQGDDRVRAAHDRLVASDPIGRDTDADGLFDGREELLGSNPNIVGDAGTVLDTDQDGLKDAEEVNGWDVVRYCSCDRCDDCDSGTVVRVSSDPLKADTDGDGLPDLLESLLRTDPTARDTDGDTLSDLREYDPNDPGGFYDPFLFDEFLVRCAEAPQCAYDPPPSPLSTHPNRADTDGDALDDGAELIGWSVSVEGEPTIAVTSDPLKADADNDGWIDAVERYSGTNPNDADTDGDGTGDSREIAHNSEPDRIYGARSPLIKDQLLRVRFERITVNNNCAGIAGSLIGFTYGVRPPDNLFRSIVDQNTAPVPNCGFCDTLLANTPCLCDDRCAAGLPGLMVKDDDDVPLNRGASFVKQHTQTATIETTTRAGNLRLCQAGERFDRNRNLSGVVTAINDGRLSVNQGNCQFDIVYTVIVVP